MLRPRWAIGAIEIVQDALRDGAERKRVWIVGRGDKRGQGGSQSNDAATVDGGVISGSVGGWKKGSIHLQGPERVVGG